MNLWQRIIKSLKAQGYKGDETLEAVKAFVADAANGVELVGSDGAAIDIEAAFKAKDEGAETKSATKIVLDSIPNEDLELLRAAKDAKAAEARGKSRPPTADETVTKRFAIASNSERKSFDAKASRGETFLESSDDAEIIGAWAKLAFSKGTNLPDRDACEDICRKANVSYDFSSGGFVVPDPLRNALINIRPKYSALAQLVSETPIPSTGDSVPRRSSGITVYSPGEGVAITESNVAGDQVRLTPFELAALSTVSNAQLSRSIISFGEFIGSEMNYAVQKKLEEIYFLGTGSSTYFNQTGLLGKLSAQVVAAGGTWTVGTNATNAEYHAAVVRGAGNLWSELTEANFLDMLARPTDVENPGNLKWACNRAFYYSTMLRIARSKGGVPTSEIINGVSVPMFEGFPVVFSNAMPATNANGQVCVYFGEFDSCTKVGNVATGVEMSTSTERYWEMSKVGYKVSMFKAVNAHDLGTANATTPTQTVPFAALVTAES